MEIRHFERITVEFDREKDGRWIAEIPEMPGVMVYGKDKADALLRLAKLAAKVMRTLGVDKRPPGR
jgi:predicted RNase H-like HicB family nuclease